MPFVLGLELLLEDELLEFGFELELLLGLELLLDDELLEFELLAACSARICASRESSVRFQFLQLFFRKIRFRCHLFLLFFRRRFIFLQLSFFFFCQFL